MVALGHWRDGTVLKIIQVFESQYGTMNKMTKSAIFTPWSHKCQIYILKWKEMCFGYGFTLSIGFLTKSSTLGMCGVFLFSKATSHEQPRRTFAPGLQDVSHMGGLHWQRHPTVFLSLTLYFSRSFYLPTTWSTVPAQPLVMMMMMMMMVIMTIRWQRRGHYIPIRPTLPFTTIKPVSQGGPLRKFIIIWWFSYDGDEEIWWFSYNYDDDSHMMIVPTPPLTKKKPPDMMTGNNHEYEQVIKNLNRW